eukprot:TRINITY_DN15910_c0_g1_i2.p1 TRINITY_DN15910_c0_g1~~TRINITY_DN15910_c0_g1_i2.p1  ORF type:complete len:394 (+),score=17.92 TRINITY_DN15910_c0_g1_i2:167-1183(+)
MMGNGQRLCQANMTLTEISGTCVGVTCPIDLTDPPNGTHGDCNLAIQYPNYCLQTCNEGFYKASGNLSRQCQPSGSLESNSAICLAITCAADNTAPLHGSSGTCGSGETEYTLTCSLSCDPGYQLTGGSGNRLCQANGTLSDVDTICTGRPCIPDSTAPANGSPGTCNDPANYPAICVQQCNSGYELDTGNFTRTCQTSGIWSTPDAVCKPITCVPDFDAPDNGNVGDCMVNLEFNQTCTIDCDDGYVVSATGTDVRTCESNQELSPLTATCTGVTCLWDGRAPYNGTVGNCNTDGIYPGFCVQTCLPGYALTSGSLTRICQTNGTWTEMDAVCEALP